LITSLAGFAAWLLYETVVTKRSRNKQIVLVVFNVHSRGFIPTEAIRVPALLPLMSAVFNVSPGLSRVRSSLSLTQGPPAAYSIRHADTCSPFKLRSPSKEADLCLLRFTFASLPH